MRLALLPRLTRRLVSAPLRELSSRLPRIGELPTVRAVIVAHELHGPAMRPIDVSACWNTLGRLVRCDHGGRDELRLEPEALRPLVDTTLRELPNFEARPLANTAHGLAVVADVVSFAPGEAMWRGLAEAMIPRVGEATAQHLANTAYAFAKAQYPARALFEAVAAEAVPRLGEFTPQDLAITVWAFARFSRRRRSDANAPVWADQPAPALFEAVAAEAVPRLGEFSPQNLAITVTAFARADQPAPELFEAVAAEAVPRLGEFAPQDLADMARAFSRAGHGSSLRLRGR